ASGRATDVLGMASKVPTDQASAWLGNAGKQALNTGSQAASLLGGQGIGANANANLGVGGGLFGR
uniref:Uncharacterized protein n=1 Tax=Plectus sambesii TaxID=2011161 RepID=A0A914VAW9_9BILA